ncbi:MAG: hypothetical protein PHE02_03225 [Lachnospiraceae bacterium]|nr:hypothetical protein [Lachnospiraceae bacterium]
MRGAWEADDEYILELRTEGNREIDSCVGYDGEEVIPAHVNVREYRQQEKEQN